MSIGGWLDAWMGIVSLGWVLVMLVVISFAAGVIWSSWWKDRGVRRSQRDAASEHHRQHLARKQREKERAAGDARLYEDVKWQWVDVLADLRATHSDGAWFDFRGCRPLRVIDGVTLVVAVAPERLDGPALSSKVGMLRRITLAHAVEKITRHRLDVELVADSSPVSG